MKIDPIKFIALAITFALGLGAYLPLSQARTKTTPYGDEASKVLVTNDNFANAQLLVGNSGSITGASSVGATHENFEPTHALNRGGASVWYKYVAAADGVLTVSTQTSNFDTLLSVYKGSTIDTIKLVTEDDDTPIATTSSCTFAVKSGSTYEIAVDGYYNSGTNSYATGSINLNYTLANAPANDNFANAQLLTGSSGRFISTSNVGATKEAGEPTISGNAGGKSVWFKWVAPAGANRTYSFRINSANLNVNDAVETICAVYSGTALNALTLVNQMNIPGVNDLPFSPVPGTTYYLSIDGIFNNFTTDTGSFTIDYGIYRDQKMADFDHDGRADIAVFRPSNGTWYSIDTITGNLRTKQFGTNGDTPLVGDFNFDGRQDYAAYRPSTSTLYTDLPSGIKTEVYGLPGDIPVLQYYQGYLGHWLFRPSNGTWYNEGGAPFQWGLNADIPIITNFNNFGYDQFTVFRPSNGTWYSYAPTQINLQFGLPGDKPVVADYDGDGIADIAVFRPSNGGWYIRNSSTGNMTGIQWGISTDIPQPADYDGDGKADVAVYRNGVWYIFQSQSGTVRTVLFGLPGDIPVTSTVH